MAARRLILVMLVLLVLSSAVAALIPIERDALDDTSTTATATKEPAPTGKLVRGKIDADRSKARTIRLRAGDQLQLTVTSSKPGQVEILEPGVLETIDPFLPVHIDLLPLDQGAYLVRLIPPQPPTARGRVIGRIVVGPRRARRPT